MAIILPLMLPYTLSEEQRSRLVTPARVTCDLLRFAVEASYARPCDHCGRPARRNAGMPMAEVRLWASIQAKLEPGGVLTTEGAIALSPAEVAWLIDVLRRCDDFPWDTALNVMVLLEALERAGGGGDETCACRSSGS